MATNGNDSFSGTLSAPNATNTDGPFATLAKAQTAVENAIRTTSGPVTVQIRSGTYYLPSLLNFSSANSGTSAKGITWEGFPGDAEPVISGGARLTGWKNTSGNTWTVAIPSSFGNFEALYYNGVRRFRPLTTSGYLTLNPVIVPSQTPNCTVQS